MIRGTTPTHIYELPFDTAQLVEVMVIYAHDDVEVFHKNLSDCKAEGEKLTVKLTQEETLSLSHLKNVQIQIRAKLVDGSVLASNVYTTSIGKCLNDEVM